MSRRWSATTLAPSTCKGPACCSCSSIGAPEYVDDYNHDDDDDDDNSRPGRGDKFSWLVCLVLSWSRPGRSQQSGDQDSDHNILVIRL